MTESAFFKLACLMAGCSGAIIFGITAGRDAERGMLGKKLPYIAQWSAIGVVIGVAVAVVINAVNSVT